MSKQGTETLKETGKLLVIGNSPLYRERLPLFGQKSLCKRERGEPGAVETKIITPVTFIEYG